jgi:hypothetical protein
VNDAVEDGIGKRRITDDLMPAVDGHLPARMAISRKWVAGVFTVDRRPLILIWQMDEVGGMRRGTA